MYQHSSNCKCHYMVNPKTGIVKTTDDLASLKMMKNRNVIIYSLYSTSYLPEN